MLDLRSRLTASVSSRCPGNDPLGIAFSGGLDSLTGTFAALAAGREVRLYTIELEGLRSREAHKAAAIARHFGWSLKIITVPAATAPEDFIRLIVQDGCKTKVQAEVTYGCRYLFSAIREQQVLMCMNADRYYGNSRNIVLEQSRLKRNGMSAADRKELFDEWRVQRLVKAQNLNSGDSWGFATRAADAYGKTLVDPYLDPSVSEILFRFDHDQLSTASKPLIRQAFADDLKSLDPRLIAVGVRMQIGARVDERFRKLLDNPRVNRFEPKCRTTLHLCQTFARAVYANRDSFVKELQSLPPAPRPRVRPAIQDYISYVMADVGQASARRLFTVVSTFAGGGGSSVGYRLAGGGVCAVNEFVPEAARTYSRNFPDVPLDTSEIREALRSNSVGAFFDKAKVDVGDVDIVDGSPPCSEFSIAGNGIADQDVPKRYSDVTQTGIATLPFAFRDFVHRVQPRTLVMENVPNLASTRNQEILDRLLEALRFQECERCYYVNYSILAASDFGVAQKRLRLFAIGVRKDIAERLDITSDTDVLRLFPAPTHGMITIRSALRDLEQKERDIEPWLRAPRTAHLGKLIRQLAKNPPKLARLPNAKKNFTLTRCCWDLPAPTLVVMGQQPNGLSGAIHPQEDRKFTLPELKRLFALPDDFILTGTVSQAAERICRMVPPLLTKAIAESIYEKVLLPHREVVNAL